MNGTWIEVFRGGKQTDSAGVTSDWTEAMIDHAVASYNPAVHEAPVVVGHPKSNAPAYGWVDGLKREGLTLLAKFKQVAPEFAQAVQDGRFKKRSVSFYPNGTLRHVGFLGAMPPAVKGLADINFGEEGTVYEYEEDGQSNINQQEEADMTLEEALRENERLKAENDTLKAKNTEFSEKVTAETTRADKAEKSLKEFTEQAAAANEARVNKDIAEFVEGLVKQGRVAPADKDKKITALKAAARVQSYEFAEDGSDTFGELKTAFAELPVKDELTDFAEMHPRGTDESVPKTDPGAIIKKM